MIFKRGFAISVILLALSASTFAMSGFHREERREHDRDDDRRELRRPVAYRVHRDHDRDDRRPAGWNKGKKEGWEKHHDRGHDRVRHHVKHHRGDWDRTHVRDRRAAVRRPAPMGNKPVSQQDRNRAWGDNVHARKAEIRQQESVQAKR